MGVKLLNNLNKQLNTEYKQDALDCLIIYNKLKDMFDMVMFGLVSGHLWLLRYTKGFQVMRKDINLLRSVMYF